MFLQSTANIKVPRVNIDSYDLTVSPAEFLSILHSGNTRNIVRTKFLFPKLGSNSLGKFIIVYKHEPPKPAGEEGTAWTQHA